MRIGAINVPLYPTSAAGTMPMCCKHSGAKLFFAGTRTYWPKGWKPEPMLQRWNTFSVLIGGRCTPLERIAGSWRQTVTVHCSIVTSRTSRPTCQHHLYQRNHRPAQGGDAHARQHPEQRGSQFRATARG
ncbi:MAG: hypothetical protein IPO90_01920 [Flavobacteriales bacterium]|nr:hypothetical protein [Flavobacteriales bacterium]